jgi:hypothetical protein
MAVRSLPDALRARPRRDQLSRVAVIGGVVLAAAMVGLVLGLRRTGMLRPELIVAGALAASSLPVWLWLRRLEYGILAILLAAGLLNFVTLPTGTQSRLVFSLVIAAGCIGLWIFKMFARGRQARLKPARINRPLVGLLIVGLLSYAWANVMRDPTVYVWPSFPFVQLAALAVNTLLPLLALFVANQITDVRWLKAITWIILGLGAFAVVSFLFHLPTAVAIQNGSRGLFATWVGVLAYSQLLFNKDLSRRARILLMALFAAVVFQYFFVYVTWFSGWVPLAVACAVVTILKSWRLTAFFAAVLVVFLAVNSSFYFQELVQTKVNSGDLQRLSIWDRSLGLVAHHFVLGMGPAGYAVYNMAYYPQDARSTHNNFFDVLAQTGVVGFAMFAWLLVAFVRTGTEVRRRAKGREGFELAFASATLAGCYALLVSMMLGDWVLPFAYNQTIAGFDNASFTWILLGAMVSLQHMLPAADTPSTPTETAAAPSAA